MKLGSLVGLLIVLGLTSSRPAVADPIVEDGLEAFLAFDEGAGDTTADLTGNGHTGTLLSTSWGNGYVTCSGEGQLVSVSADSDLRSPTFTYDLWFEANGSTGAYGRIVAQASHSGGEGPDLLESYGYPAVRITSGSDATFLTPSVGSLSTPSPPDHFGICADGFHREDGPEHLVLTHDAATRTVRMFVGLEQEPLRLCFEAQYQGGYSIDNGPLAIGNHPEPDHVFRGRYYQFAYYSRELTFAVDGNRNVIGGDLQANHEAGSDAELSAAYPPDAGVPDAGAPDATPTDAAGWDSQHDLPDAGTTPPRDGNGDDWASEGDEVIGGCATLRAGSSGSWIPLLAPLLLLARRRREPRAAARW